MSLQYKTGTLVEFRRRPWVVQQSAEPDMIVLKPLGGTDAETIGLYEPLYAGELNLQSYNFVRPSSANIGVNSAPAASRLLYDACRLSFRDIAGPFQSLGRLSFEPRPYQMVPLILALKQDKIRLLISDDVGIGKTLESLLIAKELLDRKEINRFAVICLPHLCEQWQNEIKDKFGLDAEIIRSSTVSRLEKKLRGDQNIFRDIPFQVISIDYIKSKERSQIFLDHCPELIIVDEAHTCARPKGANTSQQQRYALLKKIASKSSQQLILLTATPHSGQQEEFQSLIGLLDDKFEQYDLSTAKQREELSHYFVQRRRADISQYLGDEVVFPSRQAFDNDSYRYSPTYLNLLDELKVYIKSGLENVNSLEKRKQRYLYWDLLALMRGVMSSPEAGISMLRNKIEKNASESDVNTDDTDEHVYIFNDPLKDFANGDDVLPEALEKVSGNGKSVLQSFVDRLQQIKDTDDDEKVKAALTMVELAISEGKNPIVFCQYIQTAEYVGEYLRSHLATGKKSKPVAIGIITSRLADEERKMKIDELCETDRHVLVCTDCLSEGVNLQQGFDAIVHYDLPWNPNRVEQRNGRIDRFGQTSPEVLISTMYARNNVIDDIVLNVLYRKQREIRKQLGVYLPIAEDDASVMETLVKRIIDSQNKVSQPSLFDGIEDEDEKAEEQRRIKAFAEEQKKSHTYFAHNSKDMDPTHLVGALNEARSVIGGVEDTCRFVVDELFQAHVNVHTDKEPLCLSFQRAELPSNLVNYFPGKSSTVKISFASPTPKGYTYIGRNHPFVEDLSRGVVNDTVNGGQLAASRAMVMTTDAVDTKTTIMLMRVRSVIRDAKRTDRELVGEEMIFLGYRGNIDRHDFLSQDEARDIFMNARAAADTDIISQRRIFDKTMEWTLDESVLRHHTDDIATERANHLVEAFTKYKAYRLGENQYQVVEPVLPMDVVAAYVFLPKI